MKMRFYSRGQTEEAMESPFDKVGSSFSLYLEPMLNPFWKSYMQVITIDPFPSGPLSSMVLSIDPPKLSSFQENWSSPLFKGISCVPCVMRYPASKVGGSGNAYRMGNAFLGKDDIPSLLSYLKTNNYEVEIGLTNMLFQGNVPIAGVSDSRFSGNRSLIAMVHYKGP